MINMVKVLPLQNLWTSLGVGFLTNFYKYVCYILIIYNFQVCRNMSKKFPSSIMLDNV